VWGDFLRTEPDPPAGQVRNNITVTRRIVRDSACISPVNDSVRIKFFQTHGKRTGSGDKAVTCVAMTLDNVFEHDTHGAV
jgi:hypothetical protein